MPSGLRNERKFWLVCTTPKTYKETSTVRLKTNDAVKQLHLSLYAMKIDMFSNITGFM